MAAGGARPWDRKVKEGTRARSPGATGRWGKQGAGIPPRGSSSRNQTRQRLDRGPVRPASSPREKSCVFQAAESVAECDSSPGARGVEEVTSERSPKCR